MHWISLQWPPDPAVPPREALGWWALQFTPRVVWLDEALLLEVSSCERLWGGRQRLARLIYEQNPAPSPMGFAQAATSLIALARLRLVQRGVAAGADVPACLPLDTLTAAQDALELLARLGCRTWGDVAALPRGGLVRRFGTRLRAALDRAWGLVPDQYPWLVAPEVFEHKVELMALAHTAPELMAGANRLLGLLQLWLRARQQGVLALELQWTLDYRRVDGVQLAPHGQLTVRTAEPTQDMAHLRRILLEQLGRTALAAPVGWLSMRSLETTAWAGANQSLLHDDVAKGDPLHHLVERLSARLGTQQVVVPVAHADHRPECMQQWVAAQPLPGRVQTRHVKKRETPHTASSPHAALYPPWLLPTPQRLAVAGERPQYHGPLRLVSGPQRIEAGWWAGAAPDAVHAQPVSRDYFIARSEEAGLLWVYRERLLTAAMEGGQMAEDRWFLQGLYG